MAERRMISKKVVSEDKFLDMPSTARLLYYDLIIYADDDGFVSPKKIMRITQASDDDLKILIAKSYILIFDSGVVVLKHWRVHNQMRKDRHHATRFFEEFESMELINNEYNFVIKTGFINGGNQTATTGLPNGNQTATEDRIGKDRIGKDRIGKDRIGKTLSISENPLEKDLSSKSEKDYNQIMDMYNNICIQLPKIKTVTDKRVMLIDTILEKYTINEVEQVFYKTTESDFLSGQVATTNFISNFDWLMKLDNFVKVIEDTYQNKPKQQINKKGFHNFKQRDINYNELEQERRKKENAEKVVTT